MAALNQLTPPEDAALMEQGEDLEVDLLLQALLRRFGFDFRAYERAGITVKLQAVMHERELASVSLLQDRVLHDPLVGRAVLRALSVQPVLLFCDFAQVQRLRKVLTATLSSAALPKVWLAECAGAEEAWSLAILLAEQGLAARTEIFATVANEELLREAEAAFIPLARLQVCAQYYRDNGGSAPLEQYFEIEREIDGGRARLRADLRERITWAQYNLVTDASFNEFEMILCPRALADFGPVLRGRTLRLFHDSLALFGVIGLEREFDVGDPLAALYQPVFAGHSWYKRIA